MFKNLMDFSYKRNGKEAVGFYLAFFLLGIFWCAIGGGIGGAFSEAKNFSDGFNVGAKIGPVMASLYCLILSAILLQQKKLYKNFGFVLLAVGNGILAFLGGVLLGMVIPAVLTTRDSPGA